MKKQLRTKDVFVFTNKVFLAFFIFQLHFIYQVALANRQGRIFLVFKSNCHLSITHDGGFTLSFILLSNNQEGCEYQFFSIWFYPTRNCTRVYRWFDPTRKRTRVYCFSGRCPIHSSTDRTTTNVIVDLLNKNHPLSQNTIFNQARIGLCHFFFNNV